MHLVFLSGFMREVDLGMYHSESGLTFKFMHLPDALFLGNRIEPMTLALLAPGILFELQECLVI